MKFESSQRSHTKEKPAFKAGFLLSDDPCGLYSLPH